MADTILLISYAFPPLQLPMTPTAAKLLVGLHRIGCSVDVVTAAPDARLTIDDSLVPYVSAAANSIVWIAPTRNFSRTAVRWASREPRFPLFQRDWKRMLMRLARSMATQPDMMAGLAKPTAEYLARCPLENYTAVISLSPFHSVNPVLVNLKRKRRFRWLAQFSDPWGRNPLEPLPARDAWNRYHEAQTVEAADHILHTSVTARDLMLTTRPDLRHKTSIVSHAFDSSLFPQRPHAANDRFVIRHVGTFLPNRLPNYFLAALRRVLAKHPDWRDRLAVEFIGVHGDMLADVACEFADLWPLVTVLPPQPFLQSLEAMWDADLLVLIEHDVDTNLFVPSKISDYVGSGRPILSLVPFGASQFELDRLGLRWARPSDVPAIAQQLERLIQGDTTGHFTDPDIMDNATVARSYLAVAHRVAA